MRLDKFLCDLGAGSRSEVKDAIKKGRVCVDGAVIKRPETQISEEHTVSLDGQKMQYLSREYIMLNKPAGCVTATEDASCKTVMDYLSGHRRTDLFPVGRLDKDTEGLLLLTNDGVLAHRLLSPKKHVDKTYYARIRGVVTEEHIRLFREGLSIGERKPTLPAELCIQKSGPESEIQVTIREGKFHQIKRMFAAVNCEVLYLKRLSMGSLKLDASLKPGACRPLTKEEVKKLEEETGC